MLAYVFWHRPKANIDVEAYESAQHSFHTALEIRSASFRIEKLPFANGSGYEDWYLVRDWVDLGKLNEVAVDRLRRVDHDRAASLAADGWGGVYALVRGPAAIPTVPRWLDKPREQPYAEFIESLPSMTVWRRQMVLGPAPEFCVASPGPDNASEARVLMQNPNWINETREIAATMNDLRDPG